MRKTAHGVLAALLIAGTAATAMAQGAGSLKVQPNAQKYKTAGAKPATGRSGSATLEARALIARDTSMLLEASTSGVEAATHPGTITKMQVKIGADFTQNHNGLNAGGFWSHTQPAAPRGTSIQLQANIKGIDPKRNDVVTLSTPAVRRPDVAVISVSGPQSDVPNKAVTFFGTVKELNGDVGASANCVFSIDGTTVATTPGIWVDAAGTVSCQFQHTFTGAGTFAVGVAATSVHPGDWDMANNAAAMNIVIKEPSKQIQNGYMGVEKNLYDYLYEYKSAGGAYCDSGYYYYCNYTYQNIHKYDFSNVYFWGQNYTGAANLLQTVSARISTNGTVIDQMSMAPSYQWDNGYYKCAESSGSSYWDGTKYVHPGVYFNMCSYGEANNGSTSFYFNRIEGDAVYLNRYTYCDANGENCDVDDYTYYWYYNNYRYGNGAAFDWSAGDSVRVELEYLDIDGSKHTLDKTVTLQGHENSWQNGPHSYYDYWYGTHAWFERYSQKWANGWIGWNNE